MAIVTFGLEKGNSSCLMEANLGLFRFKGEELKVSGQFQTIVRKIFLSILAKCMISYMLTNQFINTSVQKGGIPGFSGSVEQTSASCYIKLGSIIKTSVSSG